MLSISAPDAKLPSPSVCSAPQREQKFPIVSTGLPHMQVLIWSSTNLDLLGPGNARHYRANALQSLPSRIARFADRNTRQSVE